MIEQRLDAESVKKELIAKYPDKVGKKRGNQMQVNHVAEDGTVPMVLANSRTTPGIITQRGCTYAGCKGVVLGPTRDIVNITHGPIGCGFYSWLTRRNMTDAGEDGENYMMYSFSTDLKEENIVFGGEKKLEAAIQEAYDLFHPKAISIFSTCPVGLIGDDVHAVARRMKEKLGINVFGFSCEGYKGVSQSAGHHIANNQLFKHIVGLDDEVRGQKKFRVNLLGEYNIGGDAWVIEDLLKRCGFELVATFSGNSTYGQFANSQTADLNMVMCHRSINYVAEMMEKKYGIPWIKVNFVGAGATAKSLRKMAAYFEDAELVARTEQVIAEEMVKVEAARERHSARCKGKTAMLFVGGSRAHHYQELFTELGMKVLAAGYEFAHRDDYEGRRVLPTIKIDADSRNIEEIHVEKDVEKYREHLAARKAELEAKGYTFSDYEGMMPEMDQDSLVIDDISSYETEKIIEIWKPDVFCAGVKEKYVIQKMGVACKQLHNYDAGGPYNGFSGAINFYKDIDMRVNSPVWHLVKAPWSAVETTEPALA
ncbi:MAG TPA: nitrogenase molybdenum-iron protein alpha chain [Fibrobacteria bacterium]|nr:nitrogenase molybdenum-iron protein alpha chain [Fibrobacteria bacterium]